LPFIVIVLPDADDFIDKYELHFYFFYDIINFVERIIKIKKTGVVMIIAVYAGTEKTMLANIYPQQFARRMAG